MDEPNWQWWAGRDEEYFTVGPENTREAIIQAATNDFDGEPFCIVEAYKGPPSFDAFDARDVIEQIDSCNEDRVDPDGDGTIFIGDLDKDQLMDLEDRLHKAVLAWVEANKIKTEVWSFDNMRHREDVTPVKETANAS